MRTTQPQNNRDEQIPTDEWNIIQRNKAARELMRIIDQAVDNNLPGSVGIRIPLQKRSGEIRLGNLRLIVEQES